MNKTAPIFLAMLALLFSSFACAAFGTKASLENLRMAHDENGDQVTESFASTDVFYAVTDLNDAPPGTVVRAVWTAVDASDVDAGFEVQEHTLKITDEPASGAIYFQLSNDDAWPAGLYRVDIYLDDTLAQSLEFNVE